LKSDTAIGTQSLRAATLLCRSDLHDLARLRLGAWKARDAVAGCTSRPTVTGFARRRVGLVHMSPNAVLDAAAKRTLPREAIIAWMVRPDKASQPPRDERARGRCSSMDAPLATERRAVSQSGRIRRPFAAERWERKVHTAPEPAERTRTLHDSAIAPFRVAPAVAARAQATSCSPRSGDAEKLPRP
jgi:hypothetical protein